MTSGSHSRKGLSTVPGFFRPCFMQLLLRGHSHWSWFRGLVYRPTSWGASLVTNSYEEPFKVTMKPFPMQIQCSFNVCGMESKTTDVSRHIRSKLLVQWKWCHKKSDTIVSWNGEKTQPWVNRNVFLAGSMLHHLVISRTRKTPNGVHRLPNVSR